MQCNWQSLQSLGLISFPWPPHLPCSCSFTIYQLTLLFAGSILLNCTAGSLPWSLLMCLQVPPFNGHTLSTGWSLTSWSWTLKASRPGPSPVSVHILYFLPISQSKHSDPVNLVQAKCSCLDHIHLCLHLCWEPRTRFVCLPLGSAQCRKVCKHTYAMLSFTSGNLPCPKASQEKSVNEVAANSLLAHREYLH